MESRTAAARRRK
uniref:Uncharacterized protein n=1 Tax=Arundo donax TaxID=35708 RepID=A0A0A8ZB62_ARUDO